MEKYLLVTILVLSGTSTRCRPDSGDELSSPNSGSKAKAGHDDGVSEQIAANEKEGSVISDATNTECKPDAGDERISTNGVSEEIAASEKEGTEIFEQTLDFDDDFEDIINFDFEEDVLDEEEDIDIVANDIPPSAWAIILENLANVIKVQEFKDEEDRKRIERYIVKLRKMEEILAKRGVDDFGEDELDKKIECAKLESRILNVIQDLNETDQTYVMDIDNDGVADFSV